MTQDRAARYDTFIVAGIGLLALCVSAYTAYVQRQQLRAAVWPILQYGTSNAPAVTLHLQNKGVGPAIIRHVMVTVNGQPVRNWQDALQKLLGPGPHRFSQDTINGRVLSAGESIDILVPHDDDGSQLSSQKNPELWAKVNQERRNVAVEVCYCSTLNECWTMHGDWNGSSTAATARCPERSGTSFEQ